MEREDPRFDLTLPLPLAWEPINEPQVQGDYSRPHPEDAMIKWHNSVAALIKANTPHQLVTTGFEGKQGRDYFRAIAQSRDIDYACSQSLSLWSPLRPLANTPSPSVHIWPHIWVRPCVGDFHRDELTESHVGLLRHARCIKKELEPSA